VQTLGIIDIPCIRSFIRCCEDGWLQGWHERNGGNLTYRMTFEEAKAARPYFHAPGEWTDMGVQDDTLAGQVFITTGSGRYLRNVPLDPAANMGIVEICEQGKAWRIVWGLEGGGRPTSEFPTHYMNHCIRASVTDSANRVIYHAHPPYIISMTFVVPQTARDFSRALWKSETECAVVFPQGVGVVPWMVPGGSRIAEATGALMKEYTAVVWAHHGLFASGRDFDEAFGLMHTIEQAAKIYMTARSTGLPVLSEITDRQLVEIETGFPITINRAFLDLS